MCALSRLLYSTVIVLSTSGDWKTDLKFCCIVFSNVNREEFRFQIAANVSCLAKQWLRFLNLYGTSSNIVTDKCLFMHIEYAYLWGTEGSVEHSPICLTQYWYFGV